MGHETPLIFFHENFMATDEVMKNYFARFIGHEMMFMVFSSDFHGIFTNLSFIVYLKQIFDSLHGGYWSEEMKTDVRNESLALLSTKTEQHETFPCNGSMRYKNRM